MEDLTVPTKTVGVIVWQSSGKQIEGKIHIPTNMRLSDFLNLNMKWVIIIDVFGKAHHVNVNGCIISESE